MLNKEAFVKRNMISWGVAFRSAIVITVLVVYRLNLLADECVPLLCILMPLSTLYFSLSIRFAVRNRYQLAGRELKTAYAGLGYFLLLLLNLAELSLIIWKSINVALMNDSTFYLLVGAMEAGFGAYIGLYLVDLFSNKAG